MIALVGRCVAQKAERRPSDGFELTERLKQVLAAKRVAPPAVPAPAPRTAVALTEKHPGVLVAIVKALEGASQEKPITKGTVLEVLTAQFPDRDPNGMRSTVNAQMPKVCVT